MELHEVFVQLGKERLGKLIRSVSIGKLRTYQLYDQLKTRARLPKLNTEQMRKAESRFWERLCHHDEGLAKDLAQAILVSHLDMVRAVLDFLKIPHADGFFDKNTDGQTYFYEGWQDRVWEEFHSTHPEPALLLYINHLGWELAEQGEPYIPAT